MENRGIVLMLIINYLTKTRKLRVTETPNMIYGTYSASPYLYKQAITSVINNIKIASSNK